MRRDPNDPFDGFFREIERLMGDVMGAGAAFGTPQGPDTHVDVHEYDDRITVIADLPGVEKPDIDLRCDGTTVSIAASGGERRYGERVRLPGRVDPDSARATYNNGVLEVRFDRADRSAGIDIQ